MSIDRDSAEFIRIFDNMERRISLLERKLNENKQVTSGVPKYIPPATGSLGGESDIRADFDFGKNGWELDLDETNITLAMTDGTRTFTITPVVSTPYYVAGVKYVLSSAATVIIDDTEGIWYIYFVGSTLTASQTPWNIEDMDKAFVAIVYWDATNNATISLQWELHSYVMDPATHHNIHESVGTRYASGLAVTDAGADLLNVTAGSIFDEDREIDITDGAGGSLWEQVLSPAELPLWYRDGAGGDWRKIAATTRPVIIQGNVLQLNELNGAWALANVTNNKYIVYWILATGEQSEPIVSIPGQVEGTSIVGVREANPLSSMDFGGLPLQEFKVIARVIYKGLVGGIFYEEIAIDDFRLIAGEPIGLLQTNIHASTHHADGFDELLLDEDNMVSDLATKGSSQQAIKKFVEDLIIALKAEDPLILTGAVKNQADNKGFYTGADDDLRIYHSGAAGFLQNLLGQFTLSSAGNIILSNAAGDFRFRPFDQFVIQDTDDGNVAMFDFDPKARTFKLGLDADLLAITHHGNFVMGGTLGDDERFQIPYLTGIPASVANGSIWMEADGLHIYYNGAEKIVAGV